MLLLRPTNSPRPTTLNTRNKIIRRCEGLLIYFPWRYSLFAHCGTHLPLHQSPLPTGRATSVEPTGHRLLPQPRHNYLVYIFSNTISSHRRCSNPYLWRPAGASALGLTIFTVARVHVSPRAHIIDFVS